MGIRINIPENSVFKKLLDANPDLNTMIRNQNNGTGFDNPNIEDNGSFSRTTYQDKDGRDLLVLRNVQGEFFSIETASGEPLWNVDVDGDGDMDTVSKITFGSGSEEYRFTVGLVGEPSESMHVELVHGEQHETRSFHTSD